MSEKIEVTIEIDEYLWVLAKDKLDMSRSEFVEYALRLYLREDNQESRLLKKGVQLQSELNKITGRLYKLQNKNNNNVNAKQFEEAMETVYRIHKVLGYVGKNQLQKIANQKEFSYSEWELYVKKQDGIIVKNYGELPKVR